MSDQQGKMPDPIAEVTCGRLQWAIPRDDYRLPERFLNNDTHPLYDQSVLDSAVAAERERCASLVESRAGPLRTMAYDALIAAAEAIRGA